MSDSYDGPATIYVPMMLRRWSNLEIAGTWNAENVEGGGYGFLCAFETREEAEAAYPGAVIAEFAVPGHTLKEDA